VIRRSCAALARRCAAAAIARADSAKSALTPSHGLRHCRTINRHETQTGVGTIFGSWIIGLGAKSLFLALVMTMLLSILLGTGIPDHPDLHHHRRARAPALAKLGVPLIASHMFRVLLRHHGRPLAAGGAAPHWPRRRSRRKTRTRSAGRRCASRSPATSFRSSSSIRRR
jgi:hypothetical protein